MGYLPKLPVQADVISYKINSPRLLQATMVNGWCMVELWTRSTCGWLPKLHGNFHVQRYISGKIL